MNTNNTTALQEISEYIDMLLTKISTKEWDKDTDLVGELHGKMTDLMYNDKILDQDLGVFMASVLYESTNNKYGITQKEILELFQAAIKKTVSL